MNVVENTLRMPKPEMTFECRIFNTVYRESDADADGFEADNCGKCKVAYEMKDLHGHGGRSDHRSWKNRQ